MRTETEGVPRQTAVDQKAVLLNMVYDRSGGDTHRPVSLSALTIEGLVQQDVQDLTARLVAEGLLEQTHRDRQEVYLSPRAMKFLADLELPLGRQ